MDFLNRALAEVSELFRTMTPGARITAALLMAVTVISLAYLVNSHSSSRAGLLLSGRDFSPAELQKIEAAFGAAGLSDYEVQGTKVRIPSNGQAEYVGALAAADALPHDFGDYWGEALSAGGPLTSRDDRKLQVQVAKQGELARIIRTFPGVMDAAVLYDTTTQGPFDRELRTTASVHVETLSESSLDNKKVRAIRHLVSKAIAGLTPEEVVVTDSSGQTWTGSEGGDSQDDAYLARAREYKHDYEDSIRKALAYIPSVVVQASVVLDREVRSSVDKMVYDKNAVAFSTTSESTSSTTNSGGPAGRPGLAAQSANQSAAIAQAQSSSSSEESETSSDQSVSAVPHERTTSERHGLTPEKVSVAVTVPSSYVEQVWREQNPAAEGEEPAEPDAAQLATLRDDVVQDIQNLVLTLIPVPEGIADPTSLVTVTTLQHIAPPEIPAASTTTAALGWLGQHWGTLGTAFLGLFSLVMLRSMVRSAATAPDTPAPMPAMTPESPDEPEAQTPEKQLKRSRENAPSLREELAELVQEDPAAAAQILETWIASAA